MSDYHDYEPNLEFDDTELQHATVTSGKSGMLCLSYIAALNLALDVSCRVFDTCLHVLYSACIVTQNSFVIATGASGD